MNQIIKALKKVKNEHPDGFTVRTTDLQHVKKGWVVAMKETQGSFGDTGLKKALKIALETTQTIGGWQDEGKFYWDAVMIFEDEDQATQAGIENDQIAIYQIEKRKIKFL